MDLSKFEFGADDLHEESIDVPDFIRSTLKLVGQRADHRKLTITLDFPSNLPALWPDQRKLKKMLVNLLSNAIKLTEHGGTITIRASYRADVDYAFQVIDTGIGISAKDMAKALSRFGQVDSVLNRRDESSDLDLPLAQAFTKAHGGDFEMRRKIGVGTTATVRFSAERSILTPSRSTIPNAEPV